MIFVSGQIPLDPDTGKLIENMSIAEQARRCLENMKGVLEGGSSSIRDVVKVTVYLADMSDFAEVNAVYAEYFSEEPPARAAVGVAALPMGVGVEMDCIAIVE